MAPVSRRRERSTSQLHSAMGRVSDQLNASPQLGLHLSGNCESNSPTCAKKQVRKQSLRFPRMPFSEAKGGDETPTAASSASTSMGPSSHGSFSSDPSDISDEKEDLRLQNAVLRRSLAMLQQSVVDSMKSNKGQFMGQGIFRARGSTGDVARQVAEQAVPDADMEELQVALADRRQALRVAIEERCEAQLDAECLRREKADLAEAIVSLKAELKDASDRAENASAERSETESKLREALCASSALGLRVDKFTEELRESRAVCLEEKNQSADLVARLREAQTQRATGAEDLATRSEECSSLRRAVGMLESQIHVLGESCSEDRARLRHLDGQRQALLLRLAASSVSDDATHRLCFTGWYSLVKSARSVRQQMLAEELGLRVSILSDEVGQLKSDRSDLAAELESRSHETGALRQQAASISARLATAESEVDNERQKTIEALRHNENNASQDFERKIAEMLKNTLAAEERVITLENQLQAFHSVSAEKAESLTRSFQQRVEEATEKERKSATLAASLKDKLETTNRTLKESREAEANASKSIDSIRAKLAEVSNSLTEVSEEAVSLRVEMRKISGEATLVHQKKDVAEKLAISAQRDSADLRVRIKCFENQDQQHRAEMADQKTELECQIANARFALEKQEASAAEVGKMRLALAEARSEMKSTSEKLKLAKQEKAALTNDLEAQQTTRAESENFRRELVKFGADARVALDQARQSIRIMVTAPKVSVNVGGTDMNVHAPFPIEAIKTSIREEVIPRYSQVCAVADNAGDTEIRKDVQAMVEQMALELQIKICDLMPQAEGTCNWDGFGSKCGTLAPK